ncbi:MAG: hypothetical protein PUG67_06770 [Peptoniphilaceae bacterium]|nr:hypothetical protein [Peptoniphilaceae bacterium]MDY6019146.1 hypothetical protein [Anaerococcus sp.]
MYIKNLETIINILEEKIENNKFIEYGYFIAVESQKYNYEIKFKKEIINNNLNSKKTPNLIIPKMESYYFLKWCSINNYIPMIIHTHPYYLKDACISFSNQDYAFNNSFIKLGKKLGLSKYIFFVTNCIKYQIDYYDEVLKYRKLGDIKNVKEK